MNLNRIIKFRVWDIRKRCYLKSCTANLNFLLNGQWFPISAFIESESFIVQQFTGLKDKNDVEIYEGDIVEAIYNEFYTESTDFNKQVMDIRIFPSTNLDARKGYGDGDNFEKYTEVNIIGNICQNINLLPTNRQSQILTGKDWPPYFKMGLNGTEGKLWLEREKQKFGFK